MIEWQEYAHVRGIGWDLEDMNQVYAYLSDKNKTQNGVKSSMLIDCIELEIRIFPYSYVMLGLANRILKYIINYANLVLEYTPEVMQDDRQKKIEAEHTYATIKRKIKYWGTQNRLTIANMNLSQGYLDEKIEAEG